MTVAIHQPNFLPWGGYFEKIKDADVFVVFDDLQYSKKNYTNRAMVQSIPKQWITVPVIGELETIRNIKIYRPEFSLIKIQKRIKQDFPQAYKVIGDVIEKHIDQKWDSLSMFNLELIERIVKHMAIDTEIIYNSEFSVEGTRTERIINIVKALGGDTYLSGLGGSNYLDMEMINANGLELKLKNYLHTNAPESIIKFL